MSKFDTLLQLLKKFRDERDWEQFHNAKDLALAINVEAGELFMPRRFTRKVTTNSN